MRLLLLFMIVPLIEIALFIQVGGAIGLGWTLAIVILTAMAGTALVRSQGTAVMGQVRGSFENLSDPTEPLAHGAMILFSGALLLTPGFFTDAVGFALLIPGIRGKVYRFIRERVKFQTVTYGQSPEPPGSQPGQGSRPQSGDTIIDGDYEDVTRHDDGPSGWTRH